MNLTRINQGLVAALMVTAHPVQAQEWILGAGFADFSRDDAIDSSAFVVEYQHAPFHTSDRWSMGWGAALTVHHTGDVFVGAGLVTKYDFNRNWFVEGSVMPGAFVEDVQVNDLGSTFEIRSLLGVGYEFESGNKLSFAITHKSNASTAPVNPGVNSLLLRWHTSF